MKGREIINVDPTRRKMRQLTALLENRECREDDVIGHMFTHKTTGGGTKQEEV